MVSQKMSAVNLLFGFKLYCEKRRLDSCVKTSIEKATSVEISLALVDLLHLHQVTDVFLLLIRVFIIVICTRASSLLIDR